ncbi:hypothetical protein TARUN_5992 [Trichoderma arundinaceum]|uniref:Uncharacterized protein n=1 Tax=Trichoderma arundinaceum TaxID=490622 RepID=A0A395NJF8_TRIAR|nr:hypothetical protein TARUN_5992 [Trichoderma arundinaceum]
MSDGIAPAVDKARATVGAPVPTAPEAQAGAPTMETAKPEEPVNPPASLETPREPPIIAETKAPEEAEPTEEPLKATEAFKLAHQIPRPVEVQSVPETPVNLSTPVNGSPRPELKINMEPEEPEKPEEEPVVITGVQEPLPTPTASIPNSDIGPDSIVDKPVTPNGESKTVEMAGALQTGSAEEKSEALDAAVGEKRKQPEAPADVSAADEAAADKEDSDESEPADKKAKIDNGEATTNGGGPTRGRPGRPKKDKKAAPVVGKTLRKTRSQGPVEI